MERMLKYVWCFIFNLIFVKSVFLQEINEQAGIIFKVNSTKCTMYAKACRVSFYLEKSINIDELTFKSENEVIFDVISVKQCSNDLFFDIEDLGNFKIEDLSCFNLKNETKANYNIYEIELKLGNIGRVFLCTTYKTIQIEHHISVQTAIRPIDK